MFCFLLLRIGTLYELPTQDLYQLLFIPPNLSGKTQTYCMNFSSSLLVALVGGPSAFAAFDPPMERNAIRPVVLRVAIASYMGNHLLAPRIVRSWNLFKTIAH